MKDADNEKETSTTKYKLVTPPTVALIVSRRIHQMSMLSSFGPVSHPGLLPNPDGSAAAVPLNGLVFRMKGKEAHLRPESCSDRTSDWLCTAQFRILVSYFSPVRMVTVHDARKFMHGVGCVLEASSDWRSSIVRASFCIL
jgi:hypothetical protein